MAALPLGRAAGARRARSSPAAFPSSLTAPAVLPSPCPRPFCSPSNFLVAELAFKSSKLGKPDAPRPPTVLNGSEVEEAARELRQTLYEAADAEEEDDEGGWARRVPR